MNYLLWTDFETTGLNPRMDTVLEAAWTITNDVELRMLSPLRARLCLIDPPNRRRDANQYLDHPLRDVTTFDVGNPFNPAGADEGDWFRLPQVVQDMHEGTGLKTSLQYVKHDPINSLRLLTDARDLARLIAEDLADVGYNREQDRLILAGAGVSHFDNRVFDHHLPGMFPLAGESPTGYAYWQHDVSIARRVIGENTWAELESKINNPKRSLRVYGCQVVVAEQGYAPVRVNAVPDALEFDEPPFVFMPDELTGHRAADDVVRALIDGRIMQGVHW